MISRNQETCTNCLLCVRDCIAGVWRAVDGKPEAVAQDLCNRCSHCLSVCPADAIVHDGLDESHIEKVDRKALDSEAFRKIAMSRRSIRNYRDKRVPKALIEQILDLARHAPTASNDQNVGYIVVTDRDLIRAASRRITGIVKAVHARFRQGIGRRILVATGLAENRYVRILDYMQEEPQKGRDFILYDAPVLILMHGPKRQGFAGDNCSIAADTIVNYAHSLGLGTCFTGLLTAFLKVSSSLRKELGVPEGRHVYTSMVMGYPAYIYARTAARNRPDIIWKSPQDS